MSRANSFSLSLPPQEMPIKPHVGEVAKWTVECSACATSRDWAHSQWTRGRVVVFLQPWFVGQLGA
ncbi:MAG: hypothetical protein RLZZ232_1397 [Planctomycetota bacterium]